MDGSGWHSLIIFSWKKIHSPQDVTWYSHTDMGMRELHSLLTMYALAERQTCDHDWYWWRNHQNVNTWWIFKLRKLVSFLFIHWRMKTHKKLLVVRCKTKSIILDMEESQIPKVMSRREHGEKRKKNSLLNQLKLLVKQIRKEKTFPRGKRQLLILVLSEIRRVSLNQPVMETQ